MEMLYGALAHAENENGGFGFSVPRMRNQQIFEANSGFKICLLRFHFSMVEAKTGLKFEAVFGLKKSGRSLGFSSVLWDFFCVCAHGAHRKLAKLDAQGLVLNDGLLASDSTPPSSHKAGKSPGSTNALAVFALVG